MNNDAKWKETFNITNEKWNDMKNEADKLFNNLSIDPSINYSLKDKDGWESNQCPMAPYRFFQLSSVSGFNNLNGYTYEEYILGWKKRHNKIDSE